jgi:nucleoside-diphosphate-sugar epimerase
MGLNNMGAQYGPERRGDVRYSKASVDKIINVLGYEPGIGFRKGLEIVLIVTK